MFNKSGEPHIFSRSMEKASVSHHWYDISFRFIVDVLEKVGELPLLFPESFCYKWVLDF